MRVSQAPSGKFLVLSCSSEGKKKNETSIWRNDADLFDSCHSSLATPRCVFLSRELRRQLHRIRCRQADLVRRSPQPPRSHLSRFRLAHPQLNYRFPRRAHVTGAFRFLSNEKAHLLTSFQNALAGCSLVQLGPGGENGSVENRSVH